MMSNSKVNRKSPKVGRATIELPGLCRTQKNSSYSGLNKKDDDAGEQEEKDPDTLAIVSKCAEELDRLISSQYNFVDIEEPPGAPLLVANSVDHCVSLYIPPAVGEYTQQVKRKPNWKPKGKEAEKITNEDIKSIAVSGEWVLNKSGVYLTGRQRRSELITGAVHSPALKKSRQQP